MRPTEPLPLYHSWSLDQVRERLPLAWDLGQGEALAAMGAGLWQCDLSDDRLTWTAGVFDLFGLSRRIDPNRPVSLTLYRHDSRAALERLRAYAIKHKRGFTLDAEICPASANLRWMRLVALPVLNGSDVVALRGVKHDVTPEYRHLSSNVTRIGPTLL